jgi:Mitochondrial K+-H+ exchange-related
VKIYLVTLDDGRTHFHSEGPSVDDGDFSPPATPERGFRGWLERHMQSLNQAFARSDQSVMSWIRRVWTWLHQWTHPDEEFLRSLRLAEHYEVFHAQATTEATARRAWRSHLASRRRRHLLWLIGNILIVPPAVLAAVLPGPNVLGYWFIYRAWMHALAWRGTGRALGRPKQTRYEPASALNEPVAAGDEAQIARLAEQLNTPRLGETLRRASSGSNIQTTAVKTDATAEL